jgi:hypothetical protein
MAATKLKQYLKFWTGEEMTDPPPIADLLDAVEDLKNSGAEIWLRCRPETPPPAPYAEQCKEILSRAKGKKLKVPMGNRIRKDASLKPNEIIIFEAPMDRPFAMSVDNALRLINREPWCFLFEEVPEPTEK